MAGPLRILTVVGARPQFIKAAALTRAIAGPFAGRIQQTILHTGQHFDTAMSEVFFQELGPQGPDLILGGDAGDASRFGRMMAGVERTLVDVRPHVVLVYGDTTSTLAGAMAACRMGVPLAHVEAGLRSFDNAMPEEENRVLTDHASTWLFCPTETAVDHLRKEGVVDTPGGAPSPGRQRVMNVGDVMLDNALFFRKESNARRVLDELHLRGTHFAVATVHRAGTADDVQALVGILDAFNAVFERTGVRVIVPLHPRTRRTLGSTYREPAGVRIIAPIGYLDMLALVGASRFVLTDSGGLQKEAGFLGKRSVILRENTEWSELLGSGGSVLAGTDPGRILSAAMDLAGRSDPVLTTGFGDGHAAEHICNELLSVA